MTTVEVFMDCAGVPRLVGQAHFTRQRGRLSTTFLYDVAYLAGGGMSIDPALPLVSGAHGAARAATSGRSGLPARRQRRHTPGCAALPARWK